MLRTLRFDISKACLPTLTIIFLVSLTPCQTNETSAAEDIVCKISSTKSVWQQNKPAMVVIELVNRTKKRFSLKVVPELVLRPIDSPKEGSRGYWSPVDIVENHPLRTKQEIVAERGLAAIMAQPIDLRREADTMIRYKVDAAGTKWEKHISSLWPANGLYRSVPAGKYILSMEMETKEYGRANISCGETQIEIAASSTR
jgi:hypothetical protein